MLKNREPRVEDKMDIYAYKRSCSRGLLALVS